MDIEAGVRSAAPTNCKARSAISHVAICTKPPAAVTIRITDTLAIQNTSQGRGFAYRWYLWPLSQEAIATAVSPHTSM